MIMSGLARSRETRPPAAEVFCFSVNQKKNDGFSGAEELNIVFPTDHETKALYKLNTHTALLWE